MCPHCPILHLHLTLCIIHWLLSSYATIIIKSYANYLIIPQNVNIVAEISVLLQTLSEHLNSKNMGITQKAIQVEHV